MKVWKKVCALLVILTLGGFGALAQQDDKKKPKVPIVDKKDEKQDKDKNRDEKKQDKKPDNE